MLRTVLVFLKNERLFILSVPNNVLNSSFQSFSLFFFNKVDFSLIWKRTKGLHSELL